MSLQPTQLFFVLLVAALAYFFYNRQSNSFLFNNNNNNESKPISLIILNANIWTGDYSDNKDIFNSPIIKRAQALAVHSITGRILGIGSNEEVLSRYPKSQAMKVIDLKNQTNSLLIPGFIDSHVHVILGGKTILGINLRYVTNRKEFVETVRNYLITENVKPNEWVFGGEWCETKWNVDVDSNGGSKLPHRKWIDEFTPNNPVLLYRLDAHSCLVNSLALKLANITKDTIVEGGTIDIGEDGEPTGILRDKAVDLVQKVIVPPSDLDDKAMKVAMDSIVKNGITSVHHMGSGPFAADSWKEFEVFRKFKEQGKLKIRIYTTVELDHHEKLTKFIKEQPQQYWLEKNGGRLGDSWLKIGALKAFVDGSLGSRTGLVFEPYAGTNNDTGLLVIDLDTFYKQVKEADSNHHQIIVHAIGDKAVSVLLDVYERVIKESNDLNRDRRLRIEHAQQIIDSDVERFKKYNIIASMQPIHLKEDALYAESILGKNRTRQLFNIKKFMDNNVVVAMGTDWFVAPLDPLDNIHAAVTRKPCHSPHQDETDCESFIPEERITVEQSLIGYTRNAAYASFSDHEVGILKKGYLGDFTLLNQDITKLKPEEYDTIPKTKILMTVVGGKVVYESYN
ncbi:hypothetical protein ABK040_008935 [Willaertia magna]